MALDEFLGTWPMVACDDEMERAAKAEIAELEHIAHVLSAAPLPGHDGFLTCACPGGVGVLLLMRGADGEKDLVGGYVHETLWIDPSLRGRGLSPPLVLLRAEQQGNTLRPVVYTPAGRAAHAAAHRLALRRAGRG